MISRDRSPASNLVKALSYKDRSRNAIICGSPEEKNESVRSKFLNLQSSASTFFQILSQVRKLRQSAKFSKVFVKPECWKKKGY